MEGTTEAEPETRISKGEWVVLARNGRLSP